MKFVIVVIAIIAVAAQASPQVKSLQDDLREFLELIPTEDIREIARRYLANDVEFQSVAAYLKGPEWAGLMSEIASKPTWIDFKAYMAEAGVDIQVIIDFIHNLLQGAPVEGTRARRSIREFVDEVRALVPREKLRSLFEAKMHDSADFREFYGKISGEKSRRFVEDVRALPEVQRIGVRLRELGIDVDKALSWIYDFLGWSK